MRRASLAACLLCAAGCSEAHAGPAVGGWGLGATSVDAGSSSGGGGGGRVFSATPPFAPGPAGTVYDNVLCDGDSLFGGFAGPPPGNANGQFQSSCEALFSMLGNTVVGHNIGTGGITCASILSRATTYEDYYLTGNAALRSILVLECATNDAVAGETLGTILGYYQSIATRARGANVGGATWSKVVLVGVTGNAYFDPLNGNYRGIYYYTLDTSAAALVPTYFDAYLSYANDPLVGVVDGGTASGVCTWAGGPPTAQPSNYNSECLCFDALIHPTVSRDAYTALLMAKTIVPLL